MDEHLFVSYASEDGDFAEWLTLRLTTEGYKVWCDRVKLLGGESYPRDIDKAIKTQTFRMLAIISRHSLTKENPLKERTLGHNLTRERKVDFVIPLLVDSIRPDELDWMDADLTWVPFRDSWAQGLLALVKKLRSIDAPRPLPNGANVVGHWIAEQAGLSGTRERLWSNLFQIQRMPSTMYKITVPPGFIMPTTPWVYHKQSDGIFWSFELPWSNADYENVGWNDSRRDQGGAVPMEVAADLVEQHVSMACRQKGAWETPERELYLSSQAAPNGWLRFVDHKGRQSRVLAHGERTARSANGVRTRYRYYLVPRFRPVLKKYGTPVLELQIRLYFTDLQGNSLEPIVRNRRRKRITNNWWNHQWMSRVLAVGQWAFEGQLAYNLAEGRSYEITVAGMPMTVSAPLGIDEKSLHLPQVEEETLNMVDDEVDDADPTEGEHG